MQKESGFKVFRPYLPLTLEPPRIGLQRGACKLHAWLASLADASRRFRFCETRWQPVSLSAFFSLLGMNGSGELLRIAGAPLSLCPLTFLATP